MKISYLFLIGVLLSFISCSRFEETRTDLYIHTDAPSNPVSDASPLHGSIKGTMLKGKTYTIDADVYINKSDTLVIQEGVHVNVINSAGIVVKGVFISLGTKENPNWITVPNVVKTDTPGADVNSDPAYKGLWKGILASTDCPLMVIKWTHVEFGGAAVLGLFSDIGFSSGNKGAYDIYFQNPNGLFILEDSWIYGSVDDPVRVLGGRVEMFRNTFEKCGYTGGEAVNLKAGAVGDFAYNLCIGIATNGAKASNKSATTAQTNMRFYNNTFVNCGFRRADPGRGGSINYEEGAAGMYYNNLVVNCRYGPRVVPNPIADIAHLFYGSTFQYADNAAVASEFYPHGYIQVPQTTDFPKATTFLPANYQPGDVYNGTALVGLNNPLFVNAPIPTPQGHQPMDYSAVQNFNFSLKLNSPCIGVGFTAFKALGSEQNFPINLKYGASEITPPGKDIGAYQINGMGNQHF